MEVLKGILFFALLFSIPVGIGLAIDSSNEQAPSEYSERSSRNNSNVDEKNNSGYKAKSYELNYSYQPNYNYNNSGSGYGELNEAGFPKNQQVDGYFRDDGTYVESYYRNSPNDSLPTCDYIDC